MFNSFCILRLMCCKNHVECIHQKLTWNKIKTIISYKTVERILAWGNMQSTLRRLEKMNFKLIQACVHGRKLLSQVHWKPIYLLLKAKTSSYMFLFYYFCSFTNTVCLSKHNKNYIAFCLFVFTFMKDFHVRIIRLSN